MQITYRWHPATWRLLNVGVDAGNHLISPDGKTLLFVGTPGPGGGQQNLYTFSLDEFAREAHGSAPAYFYAGR